MTGCRKLRADRARIERKGGRLAALLLAVSAAVALQLRGEGDETLSEGWRFARDPSCSADWSAESLDDSSWRTVRVPHDWAIEGPFTTNEASGLTGRLP